MRIRPITRRRARRSAALDRQATLSAVSAVLAGLRGWRGCRHCCDDRRRAGPDARGGAALLLRRLLRATLLPAAGPLRAGVFRAAILLWATLRPPA
jgi:hypothetical protein